MFMPTPSALFASLLFGIVGWTAFRYGRKTGAWKPSAIGFALMGYTFFVSDARLLYAIGVALTAALFVFRD